LTASSMEDLVSLCKRRGFIYQTNELYGGLQGLYDYGPLELSLKIILKMLGGVQWFMSEMMLRA